MVRGRHGDRSTVRQALSLTHPTAAVVAPIYSPSHAAELEVQDSTSTLS